MRNEQLANTTDLESECVCATQPSAIPHQDEEEPSDSSAALPDPVPVLTVGLERDI